MLLHHVLEAAARRNAEGTALVWHDEAITFAELHARVVGRAAQVEALTAPGGRVAVLADNHPAWVEAYYAVPGAGRVLVFLNQRQHPAEWVSILRRTGAEALLGQPDLVERLRAEGAPELHHLPLEPAPPTVDALPALDLDDAAVAWVIFTSGTTAAPKGAMLTHASITAAVMATSAARPVAPDEVYAFPFPLCHVAGYNVVLHHLHGRPVVLLPRFDADTLLGTVERMRVTTCSLAPTMVAALLDGGAARSADVSSLRTVSFGAAPMPAAVLAEAIEVLGCDFVQGYGMTELSGNAVFLDGAGHRRAVTSDPDLLSAAGRPAPGVELRIVDDAGEDVGDGDVGEIAVRADQVFAGYWADEEATAAAFLPGGWFLTGDVGRIDRQGYLHVVDRKKDVIVTGGENVASREVEEALCAHPAVAAAAVVGVPDRTWGERVAAVVVARDGARLTPEELAAHVRGRLAGYKVPRLVVLADALPVNSSGKVLKRELRERLAQESQDRSSEQ